MKKFLLILLVLFCSINISFAKNVKVRPMTDFTTENPPKVWSLVVAEEFTTKDGFVVKEGSVIEGKITKLKQPKRMKRDASFVFVPVRFYDGSVDKNIENFEGKFSSIHNMDKKDLAKSGVVFVGNQLIDSTFGPGVALIEGAIKNEEGNRFKSAGVSLYESTPLSYANKGEHLTFKKDVVFVMSFKKLDEEDKEEKQEKPKKKKSKKEMK